MKLAFITIVLFCAPAFGQSGPPVPPEYRELYQMMEAKISGFERQVSSRWDGRRHPVVFAAELLTANANRGQALLGAHTAAAVNLEIDRLRSLGVQGVTFPVGFPLLYRPFLQFNGTPDDYERYLAFYKRVAAEARKREMKIIVESQFLFPGFYSSGSGLKLEPYYATLDPRQLAVARAQMIATILQEVQPDFLNVGCEPDTAAKLVRRPILATPEGHTRTVAYLVKTLRAAGTSKKIPIAAGIGTWQSNGEAHLRALCASGIDILDLHVYPVNRDFLERAIRYADAAHQCGKQVAISEAWLQKERDSELAKVEAAFDPLLYGRDAFSFWAPLDQRFLEALVQFAHWKKLAYFSPFWSRYFWSYVDYSKAGQLPPDAIIKEANRAAAAALQDGRVSATGHGYQRAIGSK